MPPKPNVEFTPSKRGHILALRDEKYTYCNIARKVGGCTPFAAWKTVQQELKHHTQHSLPCSGCPFALNDRTCRRIIRALQANCFKSFSDIAAMLECVTESQVQKTAHAMGYSCCVACQKLFLSCQAVAKRLQWAHVNNGRDWGGNVCWTDESSIELGECPSHVMVTCLPAKEFLPKNISPMFKSSHKSIMVWACVSHNRKGPIIHLNLVSEVTTTTGKKKGGGLNGPQYVIRSSMAL